MAITFKQPTKPQAKAPAPSVQTPSAQVAVAEPLAAEVSLHIPQVQVTAQEALAASLAHTQVETMVAEYVKLWKVCEDHGIKDVIKQMEGIRQALQSIANESPAEEKVIFATPAGEIEFSPRGKKTVVHDPKMLIAHLEKKFDTAVAYSVVNIGLTELKKVLSVLELAQFAEEEDGPRTLKAVRPA